MENYTHFSSLRVQGVVESSIQGKLLGSFDIMPEANSKNEGQIILYTGATTGGYIKGKYYVSDGTAWVISDASPVTVVVDSELSSTSTNPVQNKVITPVLNQLRTDVDSKVPAETGKGLSTNDYTTTEKNKLAGISAGAQVNVIESVKVNGTALTPTSKAVNIDLSNYATKGDVSAIPKFAISVVSTLPTSGISTSTIYLKSNGGPSGNSYDEYLYVNSAWEKIGTTEVDLSGYVPIERKINNKQLKTDIALTAGDVGALPADGTAVKATADANGKNIADTYATQETVDGKQAKITGAATSITSANLTASRALVSDGNGKVAVSDVTSTELGYLDGVTSAIQAQIDGKQPTITGGASTIASSNLTPSRALVSDSSGKVGVSAVTSTELEYLDGVTGNIQSQLNSKISSIPSAGNSTKPIYINSSGVPTECNYSLGAACAKAVTTSVTSESTSLVTSGGVFTAVDAKQDKLTFDTTPTSGSTNPVTSGGVYSAINTVNMTVAGKQDKLTAGTGLAITSDGKTINHSSSVTAQTTYVGSATAVPRLKFDAQGHITDVSTVTIYPPTTAGTAGQVWTSDGSGAGKWADAPSGGEVWEEVDLSNFPTDWVTDDRIKVAFRTYYATHVGSIKADANKARTPTIEFIIPASFTSMNFPLYSSDPGQYLRINNIGGASQFNSDGYLFTLEAYASSNSSTAVADLTIDRSNASTNIYKMWRLKK